MDSPSEARSSGRMSSVVSTMLYESGSSTEGLTGIMNCVSASSCWNASEIMKSMNFSASSLWGAPLTTPAPSIWRKPPSSKMMPR